MMFCLVAYQKEIAFAVIAMMAFGDAASGILGRIFGKTKLYKNKTWEGTVAGLVANSVAVSFFLPFFPLGVFLAVVATVVELLTETLEDNFLIPVFSGLVGQLIFSFF